MKKLTLLIVFAITFLKIVYSQPCLPEGITFSNQAQVDSFQVNYPECTEILGDVLFRSFFPNNTNNITNLDELSVLTSIHGNLTIMMSWNLTDLSGLEGLASIGGNLEIIDNWGLQSLSGLNNLDTVGGSVTIGEWMKWINITDLSGLEGLNYIGGDLVMGHLRYLTDFKGLDNLNTINGELAIVYDTGVINLTGLEAINSVGGLRISGNHAMNGLSGLENLEFIKGDIHIEYNQALLNLAGLENINSDSIVNLYILTNHSLTNCEAQFICNYLENPAGSINIFDNAPGCNNPAQIADSCGIVFDCLPYGNYVLVSQNEIDSFQSNYPSCIQLEGDVIIGYPSYGGAPSYCCDINNLGGLIQIESIGGDLKIKSIESLNSLSGLDNLNTVVGALEVSGYLTSLNGLENLTSIGDWLAVSYTDSLINLSGLNNLNSIGNGMGIAYNWNLSDLSGLENLNHINGPISIIENWSLNSLSGLENLSNIDGTILISNNDSLPTLTGLSGLNAINGDFTIYNNDGLNNLLGLDNLKYVIGDLTIYNNDILIDLFGIDSIDASSIINLKIFDNDNLSTCNSKSICDFLASPNGITLIENNATGCNSKEEVEDACGLGLAEIDFQRKIFINPNPAKEKIFISSESGIKILEINIYNQIGQQMLHENQSFNQINISKFESGIYIIEVVTKESKIREKLIIR